MFGFRLPATCVLCFVAFASAGAQDLSRYRDFAFGMDIDTVAKQLQLDPSAATTVYRRPEMIQTLSWRRYFYQPSTVTPDSLETLRFDFYNGALARITARYDPAQVLGLTVDDITEVISKIYGRPATPDASVIVSSPGMSEELRPVLARWEDKDYSYSLFSSGYQSSFGMVGVSKRLELLATVAVREGKRLDDLEAPLREAARQKKEEEDRKAAQEKARLLSKPNFRP